VPRLKVHDLRPADAQQYSQNLQIARLLSQ
jgi:hypothetical protein